MKATTKAKPSIVDTLVNSALQIIDANDSSLKEWMGTVVAEFGDACLPTDQGGLDGRAMRAKDAESRDAAAAAAGLTLKQAEQLTEIKRRIAERRKNFWQDCQIAYYGADKIKPAKQSKETQETEAMVAAREAKAQAIEAHNTAKLQAMETALEIAKAKMMGDKEAQEKLKVEKARHDSDAKHYKEQAAEHEATYQTAKVAAQAQDAYATLVGKLETLCKAFESNPDSATAGLAKQVLALI